MSNLLCFGGPRILIDPCLHDGHLHRSSLKLETYTSTMHPTGSPAAASRASFPLERSALAMVLVFSISSQISKDQFSTQAQSGASSTLHYVPTSATYASEKASERARKPLSGFRLRRRQSGDCRNSMGENEMLFMGNRRARREEECFGQTAAVDRVRRGPPLMTSVSTIS